MHVCYSASWLMNGETVCASRRSQPHGLDMRRSRKPENPPACPPAHSETCQPGFQPALQPASAELCYAVLFSPVLCRVCGAVLCCAALRCVLELSDVSLASTYRDTVHISDTETSQAVDKYSVVESSTMSACVLMSEVGGCPAGGHSFGYHLDKLVTWSWYLSWLRLAAEEALSPPRPDDPLSEAVAKPTGCLRSVARTTYAVSGAHTCRPAPSFFCLPARQPASPPAPCCAVLCSAVLCCVVPCCARPHPHPASPPACRSPARQPASPPASPPARQSAR